VHISRRWPNWILPSSGGERRTRRFPGPTRRTGVGSYLVGMELPGERALPCAIELRFNESPGQSAASLECRARVVRNDPNWDLVEFSAVLTRDAESSAEARLGAFVRREVPLASPTLINALWLHHRGACRVAWALVVGGSPGLGPALSTHRRFRVAPYWHPIGTARVPRTMSSRVSDTPRAQRTSCMATPATCAGLAM
jgi:hypothetical protein